MPRDNVMLQHSKSQHVTCPKGHSQPATTTCHNATCHNMPPAFFLCCPLLFPLCCPLLFLVLSPAPFLCGPLPSYKLSPCVASCPDPPKPMGEKSTKKIWQHFVASTSVPHHLACFSPSPILPSSWLKPSRRASYFAKLGKGKSGGPRARPPPRGPIFAIYKTKTKF